MLFCKSLPAAMPPIPLPAPMAPDAAAAGAASRRAAGTTTDLRWPATLGLALTILAWEAAGADAWMAQLAGGATGFAWRQHWLLNAVLHSGGRLLAWALGMALCLGVWWPLGPLRLLHWRARLQLAAGVLLSVLLVALLKSVNPAACPWSLVDYGGQALPVSHWRWFGAAAGARGGCFPAGHASAGFAFIGGWFVFRQVAPLQARRWLLAALAAGLLLGLAQQWRGAHFMSHTLWTGWLCWCLAWALDSGCRRLGPAMESWA